MNEEVCCTCKKCLTVEEKGRTNCYCEKDGHYIGYLNSVSDSCDEWETKK